jgi:hypothetical protein
LNAVLPAGGAAAPPAALAVDPVLVEALHTMASDYNVAMPGGPRTFDADVNAKRFLDNLRDFAHAGGRVFALPYGDVDVAALVHAGHLHASLLARLMGEEVVERVLGVQTDTSIAYPAGGLADAATVDVLARQEVRTVVTDDRLLPPARGGTSTPAAGIDVPTSGGAVRLLAADHVLGDAVSSLPADADPARALAARQYVFAQLAMITAEAPNAPRMQVLALPRYWHPPAEWGAAVVRQLSTGTAFSRPVPLTRPGGTEGAGGTAARAGLTYPDWARQAELPTSYVNGVEDLRLQVWALAPVRCGRVGARPDSAKCWREAIQPLQNALFRAASVASREDRASGELIGQQVLYDLNTFRGGIRVVASRIVTLTSRSGLVPVTLENDTSAMVTVVLDLSSTDRARLRSATRVERTVPQGQKVQVEIEVRAESAGTFPVDIRLLTPDGAPLSPDGHLRVLVRSSAYGMIAILITAAAAGILAIAVTIRLTRQLRRLLRARRARGRDAQHGEHGPPGEHAGPAAPGGLVPMVLDLPQRRALPRRQVATDQRSP